MVEFLLKFLGYVLITSGFYFLYFMFLSKQEKPLIFNKKWFKIVMTIVSFAVIIIGWFLANAS